MAASAQLNKLDAARRQLATAIRIFFSAGDAVSVYTLAANAWEVIDTLCSKENVESISNDTRDHIEEGKDLVRHYINSPFRNFFKHANRDPDATVEGFDDQACEGVLFLAVEDYIRLNQRSPIELQVYQAWFLSLYPSKLAEASFARLQSLLEQRFPGIRQLPRSEQVAMGNRVLEEAIQDEALTNHPKTEPAL